MAAFNGSVSDINYAGRLPLFYFCFFIVGRMTEAYASRKKICGICSQGFFSGTSGGRKLRGGWLFTCLVNLEMPTNLTFVAEVSGIGKVTEVSEKEIFPCKNCC